MIELHEPHKMTTPEEKSHQNNLFKQLVMQTATATQSHVISITSWLNRISITTLFCSTS